MHIRACTARGRVIAVSVSMSSSLVPRLSFREREPGNEAI